MKDERVRGFPAFPKLGRGPRRFARSWWGNAWLKALEDTSLDAEPLKRGRAYARTGHVGPITVSPGRIAAPVYGDSFSSGDTPYRAAVYVDQLTDREWERFGHEVAAKAGHIAALLDGQMPHELVSTAEDAGVRLLPGLGDLEPECDCPGWEHPCTHGAALCYQVAWLLDEDPFVLLLIRGRGERELQSGWMSHSSEPASRSMRHSSGPSGWMSHSSERGGRVLVLPPAPGVDPDGLEVLAADAAVRARELLAAGEVDGPAAPPPRLDVWQDTVRLAATHPSLFARLQRACGRPPEEFAQAVRAWEHGGSAGLDVLDAT